MREPTHTKPLTSPFMARSCLPYSSNLQVTNPGRRAVVRAHVALDPSAVRSCGATVSPMPKEPKQASGGMMTQSASLSTVKDHTLEWAEEWTLVGFFLRAVFLRTPGAGGSRTITLCFHTRARVHGR